MKLIWHIFLKDLRRLRLPLALWSAVVVTQYFVQERTLGGQRWDWNNSNAGAGILLWVLHLVAAWLIVPLLIHDDPLIGDQAAWRTRPISAGRLLAAKIFGMAVMLWLWPSLLTVPWWIEFGFGPGEIVRAVAVNTVGMAAFTGVALLMAVLTENFARFLAWSLVLAAAAGLGGLLLVAGMPGKMEGAVSAAVLMTRASLACGLVLAAVVVVVPMQFLWRRTALARGITAAAALGAALVVQAWPWSSAQMLAKTGLKRYALPTVSVRVGEAALMVPADPARQEAVVQVTMEFAMKGLAAGDSPGWSSTEPSWRIGEHRVQSLPIPVRDRSWLPAITPWMRGDEARRDTVTALAWEMKLSGRLVSQLRDGAGVLRAENRGAIWRGERGPVVAVRAGTGAARGMRQLHISTVDDTSQREFGRRPRSLAWLETEPLFSPVAMLGVLNPDGKSYHREMRTVLTNGGREVSEWGWGNYRSNRNTLPDGTIPVGLIGVRSFASAFDHRWSRDLNRMVEEVPFEGATLTSAVFQEAAPMRITLAETPFTPDLVVEGRLDEALRRAKAEDKRVLVLVRGKGENNPLAVLDRWSERPVRELLATRYVCVQIGEKEADVFRKPVDAERAGGLLVLNASGEEQDRLRYLGAEELPAALKANLAGKTYAATLMEELAARGGEDRKLRFQLHEALRARGELAGAFDAILWLLDHQREADEPREVVDVAFRLERAVATYGPAKAALLERRERAVENLRLDPGDVGAARLLFVITLGLRHDDVIWREFPHLLSRENPSWWAFNSNWITRTVAGKRYREAAAGVDLEKFFAEGPAAIRALLLRKLPASDGQIMTIGDWQRRLVWTGVCCVEALAGAGQSDAALRVASEVRRIDSSKNTRDMLDEAARRGRMAARNEMPATE